MPLDLSSEPFSASGGFAGEGAKRLMGAPDLTVLQTVLRESGQNSWDACERDTMRIRISLRTLTADQTAFLRNEVLAELPQGDALSELEPIVVEDPLTVLEISDFGTIGLAGPTRADFAAVAGESANFVNFIRNIGARRDVDLGGGTYGYGKMSLFAASRCSVVLVDSVAEHKDGFVRRFIGCHVGDEFNGAHDRKFTGRHWWGRRPPEGGPDTAPWYVEPATDAEATSMSEGLGMPERTTDASGLGTTVQILLPSVDADTVISEMRDTLLWFFWPKMISIDDGPVPIQFELLHEDEVIPIPSPDQFPPLDLFVDAWRQVKIADASSFTISSVSPAQLTGRMSIVRGFRNERLAGDSDLIPFTSHHVALMRPVELVVCYVKGPAIPGEDLEWAGVFICDKAKSVEAAFAASEPPAHDSWNPESLKDRTSKRIVTQSLKSIRNAADRHVFPSARPVVANGVQPPLAAAATRLGSILPADPDARAAVRPRGMSGRRRVWRVEVPVFFGLEPAEGGIDALFSISAINGSSEPLLIHASPGLVIDDKLTKEDTLPDGGLIEIRNWTETTTGKVFNGAVAEVAPGGAAEFTVRVHVPGAAGIGLNLTAED